MNDPSLLYRFRSLQFSGEIEMDSHFVRARLRQKFTRSEFVTPLKQLHPHPVRTSKLTFYCFGCLVVGLLLLSIGYLGMTAGKAGEVNPLWSFEFFVVTGLVGSVLMMVGLWHRTEEWVGFLGRDGACSIWYCRGGPDRESFDAFTEELTRRIEEAQ